MLTYIANKCIILFQSMVARFGLHPRTKDTPGQDIRQSDADRTLIMRHVKGEVEQRETDAEGLNKANRAIGSKHLLSRDAVVGGKDVREAPVGRRAGSLSGHDGMRVCVDPSDTEMWMAGTCLYENGNEVMDGHTVLCKSPRGWA
mmetsp:Transcript_23878/g.49956  ORF Transcript_23878/g.49956 Transcript_23878/m.49956 type:complete len:145 (+) Transcript_23878:346-780(+)